MSESEARKPICSMIGLPDIPEAQVWASMIYRCSENGPPAYAGRGITVCDRWKESFYNFIEDVGMRPTKLHQLDRIDNDGNYEPGNCRWATRSRQNRNRRDTIYVEIDGVSKPLPDWCDELGVKYSLAYMRIRNGWDPKKALTEPPVPKRGRRGPMKEKLARSRRQMNEFFEVGERKFPDHLKIPKRQRPKLPPAEKCPEGMTAMEFMILKANRMAELRRQAGLC